jgi:hypothetical protein
VRVPALVAALILVVGSTQIGRPGYSVDEEFTEFAVRGIHAHGVPRLPSGLLYDRGLGYSYASALVDGRLISLISAASIVLLTFALVRRHTTPTAAVLASLLIATSVPFWATATTARFYSPFLATLLAALAVIDRPRLLVLIACAARLLHELGFLLAVIPFVCALSATGQRRKWLVAGAAAASGLVIGQLLLFALHALEPATGETMVRRFFVWQVVNLFERPGDRQFGVALAATVIGVLSAPRRAWWWIVSGVSVAVMIAAFSIARATNSMPLSTDLIGQVLREGSRYPLDMFWHIAGTTPLTLVLAAGTIVTRLIGRGGAWRPAERAAHLLWIGWVLWFGVIESGITTNYLLLPLSFMLIAIAIDVDAIVRRGGTSVPPAGRSEDRAMGMGGTKVPPLRTTGVAIALIVAAIALDQWRGEGSIQTRLEAARPTIHVEGIEEIKASLQPNDRVVCTDELGCLMLVGRIDRWLALDDYVRDRFLVRPPSPKASTSAKAPDEPAGQAGTGVYTGVPAVLRPGQVFELNEDGTLPDRTIIVDIFKDYAIGNSRSWLPKAIEEDGLRVTPLLETPQARVLQVSPPERFARLQP